MRIARACVALGYEVADGPEVEAEGEDVEVRLDLFAAGVFVREEEPEGAPEAEDGTEER